MSFSLTPFILISGMLFLVTTPIQSENTQQNQTFSSSQAQDQKLASATSSSSSQKVNCSSTKPPISTEKLQTYTNPTYPNLKINFDNSWGMECTSQKARFYENILIYKVVLKKNNSQLDLTFAPIIPTGCSGGEESPSMVNLGEFKRYKSNENTYNDKDESNSYYYSKSSFCNLANKIKSNIESKDAKGADAPYFKDFVSQYETIDSILSMNLESSNPAEITQADEIIKNSILE